MEGCKHFSWGSTTQTVAVFSEIALWHVYEV